MSLHVLVIFALSLCLAMLAVAGPVNKSTGFDDQGRFVVEVEIPAGSRQAVLEIAPDPASPAPWRKMIAGGIDGRTARVRFRLPPQDAPCLFARVRTSESTTLPAVELGDPALCSVEYAGGVTEQGKIDFLGAIAGKMREWENLPRPQSQANLIAWALADPRVEKAVVATLADNVSITFVDGTIGVLLNPPRFSTAPPESPASAASSPAGTAHAASTRKTAAVPPAAIATSKTRLPGSNAAVTAFSLESFFPNSAPTIAAWLQDANYSVTNYPSTTIAQILSWSAAKPLGVLFWQAHGCGHENPDGSQGVSIVTRQFATRELSDGPYYGLLKNRELLLAIDKDQKVPYYTVTGEFIRKHVRFAPNAIVVFDSCFGASPDVAYGVLDAGAGSFASYDWLSGNYSGTPCLKVFDRLLGANQEPPISEPKERPFSLPAINWWMEAFQYDYDPSPKYENQPRPNAKLSWYHRAEEPGYILRPSVMRVLNEPAYPGEPFTKYLIEGDFGPDPGEGSREVTWGGHKMQVVRWEPLDGITIRMPSSPPLGEIVVTMNKDFQARSNPVPITEWTVPFTYELFAEGSKYAKLEMNVKFRGDIHGSRGNPEMPVQYLPVLFNNMADCTGTVTASGTHSPGPGTTITWSGGSTLASFDPNTGDDGLLRKMIRNHGKVLIHEGIVKPFELAGDGDFTETEKRQNPDGSVTTIVRQSGIGFPGFGWPPATMYVNPVTGTFKGDTVSIPGDGASGKITWPSVTPRMAPDQATIR